MNPNPILAAVSGQTIGLIFVSVVTTFCAAILFEAWRRKSLLALYAGLILGCAGWFTSHYGSDAQRVVAVIPVLALGGWLVWKLWGQKLRVFGVVIGTLLTLVVVFLTSDQANHLYFEEFVTKMWAFGLATTFAAVCLIYVLPRLDQKRQAPAALLLAGLGCLGMTAAAFTWWFTAVEMNVYPDNPVVRNRAELEAEYERTKNFPTDRGLFLIGRLSTPDKWPKEGETPGDSSQSGFIAYYALPRKIGHLSSWSTPHPKFPLSFKVTLEDGSLSQVQGINTRRKTWNWKEGGPHLRMVCLRPGDHVIMWGRPVKSKNMTDGTEHLDLYETRLVAQGSIEELQNGFLLPGRTTARIFGWIGFAMLIFSLLVIVPGILKFLHLRKHGREDPLPPGHKSIKQQWNEQMRGPG